MAGGWYVGLLELGLSRLAMGKDEGVLGVDGGSVWAVSLIHWSWRCDDEDFRLVITSGAIQHLK